MIKSAETFAFKKNALGIARKATKAIPISTNSIVPVTGEFKNLRPKTSQKVNTDNKIDKIEEYIDFKLASVFRLDEEKNIPTNSTLDKKVPLSYNLTTF